MRRGGRASSLRPERREAFCGLASSRARPAAGFAIGVLVRTVVMAPVDKTLQRRRVCCAAQAWNSWAVIVSSLPGTPPPCTGTLFQRDNR